MPGTAVVAINEKEWSVSVASTTTELIQGLSGVASIPAGTGMLFILPARQLVTVDTTEMLFPIDIIFIKDNAVLSIASNISPGYLVEEATPIDMFLEVNALEAATVEVGDIVSITITQAPGIDWSSMVSSFMPLVTLGLVFGMLGGMLSSGPSSSKKQLGGGQQSKPGSTETYVQELPMCDFSCGRQALYDGRTKQGPWAYMCEEHFKQYGVGLGTGKGQRLIPRKALGEAEKIRGKPKKELSVKMTEKDFEEATFEGAWYPTCPYCGAKSPAEPDADYISCQACSRRFRIINPFFSSRYHSIHGEPRVRLVEKYGSWAVGRAEAICPEDDIKCVTREAERLIGTIRSRYGEGMKYVTILTVGQTVFHIGDVVSEVALAKENARVRALGERGATWQ